MSIPQPHGTAGNRSSQPAAASSPSPCALPAATGGPSARAQTALVIASLVLAISAEELLGYRSFGNLAIAGTPLPSYTVLCLLQTLFAAALLAGARRVAPLVWKPATLAAHVVVCAVGTLLAACPLLGGARLPFALELGGFALLALGCLSLKIACLLLISALAPRRRILVILAGVLMQSLCAPVFVLQDARVWLLAGVCTIAGFACAAAARRASARIPAANPDPQFRRELTVPGAVLVGFGIICVAVQFLNPLSLYPEISADEFVALTFGTHVIAAGIFGVCALSSKDASYTLSARTICTLTLFAFVLLALLGSASVVPRALCTMVFSLFEFVTLLAIADLASYVTANPLRLFACYYLILRACSLAGHALGLVDGVVFPLDAPYSVVGMALSALSIVATVWLLTERGLNELFWGNTAQTLAGRHLRALDPAAPVASADPDAPAGDLRAVVQGRAASFAQAHGLTAREGDVLGLLALGRSSAFIAEELSISVSTVNKRIAGIYAKCGVHSRQELLTQVQSFGEPTHNYQG